MPSCCCATDYKPNHVPTRLELPDAGGTPINQATLDYRPLVIPAYNSACAPLSVVHGVHLHFFDADADLGGIGVSVLET